MNSDPVNLAAQRARLEQVGFLSLTNPGDAMAVYYALYHDPGRAQLWLHSGDDGWIDGFVAVCQTGFNLFQPTVVLRAPDAKVAVELLRQALSPGRPYYVTTQPTLDLVTRRMMRLEGESFNHIYRFDARRHRPEINVLVQPARAPDGSPRFVIRSGGEIAAEAGVNWRSPHFAELFVHTVPQARGRGWGKAVVSACAATLLQSGVQPLYIVAEDNNPSIRLAVSAGFAETGMREISGEGVFVGTER